MPTPSASMAAATSTAVLVVDDNTDTSSGLREALETQGFRVFTAADGQQAIAALPNLPKPCVVLLDLMMPVMNGTDFLDALEMRSDMSQFPVVIVSGASHAAESELARRISVKDFLKKPLDFRGLSGVLQRLAR